MCVLRLSVGVSILASHPSEPPPPPAPPALSINVSLGFRFDPAKTEYAQTDMLSLRVLFPSFHPLSPSFCPPPCIFPPSPHLFPLLPLSFNPLSPPRSLPLLLSHTPGRSLLLLVCTSCRRQHAEEWYVARSGCIEAFACGLPPCASAGETTVR